MNSVQLGVFLTLSLLAGSGWAGPRAVLRDSFWDLGRVPNFGHIAHTYTLENRGDSPLRVDSILPTCGCTTTDREGGLIPSGGSWRFQLAFNTGILPQGGKRIEKARIYTNDPEASPLWAFLAADVVTDGWETVDVTPKVVEVDASPKRDLTILVSNKSGSPLKLSVVETSGFFVRARPRFITLGPKGSTRIRLSVRLAPGVDTKGPVPRLKGRPVQSSLTLVAEGSAKTERLTIPGELGKNIRGKIVEVEPQ